MATNLHTTESFAAEDVHSLLKHEDKDGATSPAQPKDMVASKRQADGGYEKWVSLVLLILQNSGAFVLTKATRMIRGPKYLSTVVVLLVEVIKLLICIILLIIENRGPRGFFQEMHLHLWKNRRQTLLLSVPAFCYMVQNNLIFVGLNNLSAAAAQVLYQAKTLSTAFFSVVILSKKFTPSQWISFITLAAGVLLVQSQDSRSSSSPPGASVITGTAAALFAAGLSGFAGVYLEYMFTSGGTSLWMRNVQLCIFTIPLQMYAIAQQDLDVVVRHGMLYGFHQSTWGVVAIQVLGGLITAVVIKYAGNILKTFATVLAIICTCIVSMFVFDMQPTVLFGAGIFCVTISIWLYSNPSIPAFLRSR